MGRVRSRGSPEKYPLVFNATPLIYLAKAGLLSKLSHLPFRPVTTQAVYREVVVRGAGRHVEEGGELKNAFDSRIIEVVESGDEEIVKKLSKSGIHHGEVTVIALAHELHAQAIIDDKRARHVARTLGLELRGTPHIILQLVKQGVITRKGAKRGVDRMVEEGWYCSAKNYSDIIGAIERI